MALGVNELKQKTCFLYEGQPYVVVSTHHLKMQQRRPTVQVRMRNLMSGKLLERNFAQSDVFDPADIERQNVKFLYAHRDTYWFSYEKEPTKRFELSKEILAEATMFLKPNTMLEAVAFEGKVITVDLPVKMDFKVTQAPPAIRGDTAQGGAKQVEIETGATINVPLFIEEGDIVRLNTETGEYVERVEKGK